MAPPCGVSEGCWVPCRVGGTVMFIVSISPSPTGDSKTQLHFLRNSDWVVERSFLGVWKVTQTQEMWPLLRTPDFRCVAEACSARQLHFPLLPNTSWQAGT